MQRPQSIWCTVWSFFSSRRRHTRFSRDWSSDVCSSDLDPVKPRICLLAHPYASLNTHNGGSASMGMAIMVEKRCGEEQVHFVDLSLAFRHFMSAFHGLVAPHVPGSSKAADMFISPPVRVIKYP